MQLLPFQLPNHQVILLAPVPVCDRIPFLILLNQVKEWWEQSQDNLELLVKTEGLWLTIQSLINLVPRKDTKHSCGFDLNLFRHNPSLLTDLIMNGLSSLNQEIQKETAENVEGFIEFRTPSSGDYEADLIADLCQSIGENAFTILNNYGLETVNNIVKRLNYNNLPEEKLEALRTAHEAEQAKARFKKYAEQGKFDNLQWHQGSRLPI
jgi:hypothetical protein